MNSTQESSLKESQTSEKSTPVTAKKEVVENERRPRFLLVKFCSLAIKLSLKSPVALRFLFHPPTEPEYVLQKTALTHDNKVLQYSIYLKEGSLGLRLQVPSSLELKTFKLYYKDKRDTFSRSSLHSIPVVFIQNEHNLTGCVAIYSHGLSNDLGSVARTCSFLSSKLGIDFVAYDYTGYGMANPQSCSEKEMEKNIEVVTSFVVEKLKYPINKIIMWGVSLGAAPAISISSKFRFGGLLLQAPIASVHSWIFNIFEFTRLTRIRRTDLFENYLKIPFVKVPILILQGLKDDVVPPEHSRFLYKLYNLHHMIPRLSHKENYDINQQRVKLHKQKFKISTIDDVEERLSEELRKPALVNEGPLSRLSPRQTQVSLLENAETQMGKRGGLNLLEIADLGHSDMHKKLLENDDVLVHNILKFIFKVYEGGSLLDDGSGSHEDKVSMFESKFNIPTGKFIWEETKHTRSFARDASAYYFFSETFSNVFININFEDPALNKLSENLGSRVLEKSKDYRLLRLYLKNIEKEHDTMIFEPILKAKSIAEVNNRSELSRMRMISEAGELIHFNSEWAKSFKALLKERASLSDVIHLAGIDLKKRRQSFQG